MRPRAPGRPPVLSRPRIVDAARHIADHEGLDALTVRAVARCLGTGQASLYRHIAGRRELLSLLADDIAARLPLPDEDLTPRERFAGQWLGAYDYLARHRWAARIIAEGEYASAGGAPFAQGALSVLAAVSGAAGEDVLRAYRVLWRLLLGHLLDTHPVGHTHGDDEDDVPGPPVPLPRDDFAWALPLVLTGLTGRPGD